MVSFAWSRASAATTAGKLGLARFAGAIRRRAAGLAGGRWPGLAGRSRRGAGHRR